MTIDINELADTVKEEAYPVMIQSYDVVPSVFDRIAEVRPLSELANKYGTKGTTLEAVGEFRDRLDGQEAEADQPGKAYTWQLAVKQPARRVDIPQRSLDSMQSAGRIVDYVQRQAAEWGKQAIRFKEARIAGMLQDGTLTAGSLEFFDNSYLDEYDPNAGFIYDGLPFFDGAHTLSGASGTFSNIATSRPLTRANLETTLTTMRQTNAVNDRGDRIMIMPNALIVPPALEYTARRITQSELDPGSANNDINAVRGMLEVIVNPYLTDDSDAWWVADTSLGGIIAYDSGLPTLETFYDPIKKVLSIIPEFHFGSSVKDWRGFHSCNKADS